MKLPSLLLPLLLSPSTADITLNQRVCMTGFIMDTFCIERGTLLDNGRVTTMANPELHSYHCLLDIGVCFNSGFNILGDKDSASGLHCPGLRIDQTDTNTVLQAGRAHGTTERRPNFFSCDTCTGPDDNPIAGYRATIIGTVSQLGDGLGVGTGVPGARSVSSSPVLSGVQVLDASVGCPSDVVEVSVEALGGECLIRSGDEEVESGATSFVGAVANDVPDVQASPALDAAPTTIATTFTSAADEGVRDCSNDFCEKAVTEGYLLRYKINEEEATVSMEVIYDGDAWVGIAFSEDERMGGSDGVIGTPDTGIPQKYRLGQGFIELMSPEEQTLTNASIQVVNGQTVMKFTKPLLEPNQIPVISGLNQMLWAHGADGTTNIGYHGLNRAAFSLSLSFDGAGTAAVPVPATVAATPPPTPLPTTPSLKIGDRVCTTGFIMDTFCIDRGTLLDNPRVETLKNPELHSYHCLLDITACTRSGFQVLGEKNPTTGEHCLGYRLGETERVLAAGRAHGTTTRHPDFFRCSTCFGPDENPIAGYRATVIGTVAELGDGSQSVSGQPLLTNIEMLDSSVECDMPAPQTVCLGVPPGTAPSPTPGSPAAGVTGPAVDCSSQFCETTLSEGYLLRYMLNEDEGTVSMELVYDGEAWLGIAFSEDERMGNSDGIIGSPDSGIPEKYRLEQGFIDIRPQEEQTLTDASVEIVEGQTIMKFTKLLVEPGEIEVQLEDNNMLWAHGGDTTVIGYHGENRGPFSLNLSSGTSALLQIPNRGAWLAHGICAFVAWGMLAPSAVNSAIYRSVFKGPTWFKLHRNFNASTYALTVIAFAIAVAFKNKEQAPHWFTSHARMGLSMFIIASVQVLWGAVRPHLPEPDSGDDKTTIRKVWEIKHRLTGTVLLACGFWQMYAGIKLFAIKYGGVGSVKEQGVTLAYWIWVAVEVALLFFGGVYFKLLKKPAKAESGKNAASGKSAENDAV